MTQNYVWKRPKPLKSLQSKLKGANCYGQFVLTIE